MALPIYLYRIVTVELGEEFAEIKSMLKKMDPIPDPFLKIYPSWTPTPVDVRDSGPPLILSDLEPGVARSAAKVTGPLGEVEGYSGFVNVEPKYNSSLYFWYFPSKVWTNLATYNICLKISLTNELLKKKGFNFRILEIDLKTFTTGRIEHLEQKISNNF